MTVESIANRYGPCSANEYGEEPTYCIEMDTIAEAKGIGQTTRHIEKDNGDRHKETGKTWYEIN